ncbi:tetratricopeptide repeat protein [Desulfobacter curvatus]|uniref:tetratricopeptide repeat protein n=1 Tax=Desulfobacter curvatus TaxID=2290 RepID=UPI000362608F|nr:hypothetical protein [Desulfobacter curvatus]
MNQIDNNLCFVIMPFSTEFKNQWELAYVPAIKEADLIPYRGDEEALGTNIIMRDVTQCIYNAKLIIADLTYRNPNVMYELGLAHSAKKPVIILTQSKEDIPFDVQHIRYLKYDPLDLKSLRHELSIRIESTLAQAPKDIPDFFPELALLNDEDLSELTYLRNKATPVEIDIFPPNSDVFFNDKLIDSERKIIYVNPLAPINTISAAAVEYFEHHQDISTKEIENQKVTIKLDPRDCNNLMQRVPMYLKYRRRDPNNPVMMRAIAQFLFQIDELDEALIETKELISVTPNWFLAHYLFAHIMILKNDLNEAVKYYNTCITLRPDHAIGYIGLSCALALSGKHEAAIEQLKTILGDQSLMETYRYMGNWKLSEETDFDSIRKSNEFKTEFDIIIKKLEKS